MSPINRAKCYVVKNRIALLSMCFICLLVGASLAMIIGRTQPGPMIIAFGGNTDPGDGNGNGLFKDQLVAGGWAGPDDVYQVKWDARIEGGTISNTNEAMAAGKDAMNRFCGERTCIIAGFSLGTSPALQLAAETGTPPENNYIFGGPAPATGIWHNAWVDNPWIEPAVRNFGMLAPDRFVPPGTQVFFDVRDPYANAAPQCSQPWALNLQGHRVITKAESTQRVWTGPDGAIYHEANYVPQPQLPLSGGDPTPIWAGCYLNDWRSTPNSPNTGPEDSTRYPGSGVGQVPQENPQNPEGGSPLPTDAPGVPQNPIPLPGG